jgi:hypothetical protein
LPPVRPRRGPSGGVEERAVTAAAGEKGFCVVGAPPDAPSLGSPPPEEVAAGGPTALSVAIVKQEEEWNESCVRATRKGQEPATGVSRCRRG